MNHLPAQIENQSAVDGSAEATSLDQIEAEHIRNVLATTQSIEEAATKLGINPSTLYRKRKRYGI